MAESELPPFVARRISAVSMVETVLRPPGTTTASEAYLEMKLDLSTEIDVAEYFVITTLRNLLSIKAKSFYLRGFEWKIDTQKFKAFFLEKPDNRRHVTGTLVGLLRLDWNILKGLKGYEPGKQAMFARELIDCRNDTLRMFAIFWDYEIIFFRPGKRFRFDLRATECYLRI